MQVSVLNSTYINENQDEYNIVSDNRMILNSDLDISNSGVYQKNKGIKKNKKNKNSNNKQNDNNNHQNNNNNAQNDNNNAQNNNNNVQNNNINANNNNNENNNNLNQINLSKKKLIEQLKNENFIFFREYYNQKLDENNSKYISWLKKLYIKLNYPDIKSNQLELKPSFNQKYKIPEYPILKEEIENELINCMNPYCNCVVYMTERQKEELREIKDFIFKENSWFYNGNYKKTRCPICLKYICHFCNRSSTLLNANCCYRQIITAYGKADEEICNYYCIFGFLFIFPIIRVFYMACLINFGLFRGITRKDKLLQSIENINGMIHRGTYSDIIYAPYQSKFNKVSMIIIGLLNIFGSILWALPYFFYIEIFLNVSMFTCCCVERGCLCKMISNYFYLLAFIPGLRKHEIGKEII